MASSYSTDLKLELMVTGENSGTWGDKTNTNLDLLQQAVVGYQAIALTSTNTTLAMTNATISDARNAVLEFTGVLAANATVFVASGIEKTYTIKNSTTGAFTLALNQVGGSSVIWGTTDKKIKQVYLDGTNANTIDLSTLGGSVNTSTALAGGIVTSTQIASFAVTSTGLDTSAVTSFKVASFAITSGALDTSSVTSFKIAAGAVGPTQLSNTAVTAGAYTAASITVDAQGRITAASSGGGSGSLTFKQQQLGPASGTLSSATASKIFAFINAGQGNTGPAPGYSTGGSGGMGGAGLYITAVNAPFSQPYTIGGAAATTTIANIGIANAGTIGNSGIQAGPTPGNVGTAGTAPGATFDFSGNNNTGNFLNADATSAPYTATKYPPQGLYSEGYRYQQNNAGQGGRPGTLTVWFTE